MDYFPRRPCDFPGNFGVTSEHEANSGNSRLFHKYICGLLRCITPPVDGPWQARCHDGYPHGENVHWALVLLPTYRRSKAVAVDAWILIFRRCRVKLNRQNSDRVSHRSGLPAVPNNRVAQLGLETDLYISSGTSSDIPFLLERGCFWRKPHSYNRS